MSDRPLLNIARTDGRRPLVFCWGVSSFFGWGIYGMNLLLSLAEHPDYVPICALPFGPDQVVLDPLRERRIIPLAQGAQDLWDALASSATSDIELDHPLLEGLGQDLVAASAAHDRRLYGKPSVGVVFLEEARLTPEGRARAERFALIVAGSSWNERVLRANGVTAVTTVLQGVDTALYHPGPRAGLFPGRFVVFSGGKLEFRKGQDLVLAAFRAFHQRHREALLLTAWHSPWSDLAASAVAHPGLVAPRQAEDGTPDVVGWAVANGIPPDAVVSVGRAPNIVMPHVIREADVALFANRAEGGTNPVAMECLASGVPCILSANTGHLDLLQDDMALPLNCQGPVPARDQDTQDWGESDIEEMLEKLETVWRDRSASAAMAARGVARMAEMTWQRQIGYLVRALEPLLD